jgi:type II secretory pathway pseudopilin PulG
MMEVLVAIAVVSVVMLSLTSFFVISTRIDSEQGDRLAGIQAADDAMERVRGMQAAAILTGRDLTSSTTQWTSNTIAGVQDMLDTTTMAYDTSAVAGAGAGAALPTTYRTVTLNGTQFRQVWYVGTCQRASGASSDCLATALTSGYTPFYRVIVAVTWPGRSCASSTCAYVTSSLIGSNTNEPIFNTGTPDLTAPSTQTNDQSVALSFTVTESGGATPLTWTASSLPTGLSIDTTSGTITGTPTATGTFSPTVNVTDAYGVADSASFSWVIKALPAMTAPGAVSSPSGVAFTKTFVVSNGTTPYVWTAAAGGWGSTGLPPGLSLGSSTGTVSGTPTTVGTNSVTLTVTDQYGQGSSQTFSWTVS